MPTSARACSPAPIVVPVLHNGWLVPADGVVAFNVDPEGWQLDLLLEPGQEAPQGQSGYFHREDVVRVTSSSGEDVPGTLEAFLDVQVFRPSAPLAPGMYTVTWTEYPGDSYWPTVTFVVPETEPTTDYPELGSTATALHLPGDYANCDDGDVGGCSLGGHIARADLDMARVAVTQKFVDEVLRSQLVTHVTRAGQTVGCTGCDELEVLRTTEAAPSHELDVTVYDLRTQKVAVEKHLSVVFDGPLGSTPRTLTADDLVSSDCVEPPDELVDEWCDAFVPLCAKDSGDWRCDNLASFCDGHTHDDPETDEPTTDDPTTDDPTTDEPDIDGDEVGADDSKGNTKHAQACSVQVGASSTLSGGLLMLALGLLGRRRSQRSAAR